LVALSIFDLSGTSAVVTGSSRGIGRALARGLLEAGARVVITGRSEDALAETKRELFAETGGEIHAVAFDSSDPAAAQHGVATATELLGGIDVLVNNAGMQFRHSILEFPDQEWRRLIDTNVSTAFFMAREVASGMAERKHGKIINICSLQSELARPGIAAYAATKGALKMLTKGLCADLGGYGIQVNGIGPGYFETDLTAALVADEDFSRWVQTRTPAGRWGRTEDLIGVLVLLSSRASDFINGQIIYVDGGMSAVL
jgi:gluconate 5-dehydrogenase